jgi:hypothetical protein
MLTISRLNSFLCNLTYAVLILTSIPHWQDAFPRKHGSLCGSCWITGRKSSDLKQKFQWTQNQNFFVLFYDTVCHHHHHHLQGLRLLAHSVLIHPAIFMTFLDYVFISVGNIRVAWELFLMASSVDVPANSSTLHVFVCPTSSLLVMTLFRFSFPCRTEYNLLRTMETTSLLLPVVFHLFF